MRHFPLSIAIALMTFAAAARPAQASPRDSGVHAALDALQGTAVARVMSPVRRVDPDRVKRLGVLAALEEARATCPAVKRALEADPALLARIAADGALTEAR